MKPVSVLIAPDLGDMDVLQRLEPFARELNTHRPAQELEKLKEALGKGGVIAGRAFPHAKEVSEQADR